ncbi:MAG: PHP domain-containing protein [Actinomycetota bacterium]|nr:PHP domain-containing protein [Actinomycetota bacterium]
MAVDLHLHSTASDGTLSPAEIIAKAHEINLTAIALTDHDSLAGIREALDASIKLSLTFVPGLEMSSEYGDRDIHILGYFIDYTQPHLTETLAGLRVARVNRARTMVERLAGLGLEIDFAEVEQCAHGGAMGRPHVAQILVKHGLVTDISEAFARFIGRGGPAYASKHVLTTAQIIELIHRAGGVASLAHPGVSRVDEPLLRVLKDGGLDAVEVWHTDHTLEQTRYFKQLAFELDLMVTGGSDCHGFGKSRGFVLGSLGIPDEIIEPLRTRAGAYKVR